MARIVFDNPNDPEQPAAGVYRWFYHDSNGSEVTIYVGCAGQRKKNVALPSTLRRGILEAQRSCISSNKGLSLDTDFVVGMTLQLLKDHGYDCHWQHIADNPNKEKALCREYKPLLQDENTYIKKQFKLTSNAPLWNNENVQQAKEELQNLLPLTPKLSSHSS